MKHSKIRILIALLLIFSSINLLAQEKHHAGQANRLKIPLEGRVDVKQLNGDFYFNYQSLEMPAPGAESYRAYLLSLKAKMPKKKRGMSQPLYRNQLSAPSLTHDMSGNIFNGHVPNDNDLAISNDGKIVSVINSVIYFYHEDSMISDPVSLPKFAEGFFQTEGKYDPKVLYDPHTDRFILTFLNGFNDSTSYLFLAFSETSDPTGKWNIYTIPGNPLSDSSWSDFPMIALSQNELFYTINLLRNKRPGETWKTTFKQTIIWQIDKNSGYAGDSLELKFYDSLAYGGTNLRNLCPVQGGSFPVNKNMYFLSNRNFSTECDSIFIVEITGELDDPNTGVKINLAQTDSNYGAPPTADQPGSRKLETNDARVLDAYLENGVIHFVGNSINFHNNYASIYHGKIENLTSTMDAKLQVFYDPVMEYGYPSIQYTGEDNEDEAIILANHSSTEDYPGVSTCFYKDGKHSPWIMIKEGETFVNIQSGIEQRWGDYTGLQRKFNEEGIVWGSGYYGRKTGNWTLPRVNGSWIFKLESPTYSGTKEKQRTSGAQLYPNPVTDRFVVSFEMNHATIMDFQLFSSDGRLVQKFTREYVKEGKNMVSFEASQLEPGPYFLRGTQLDGRVVLNEKVLIK